MAGNLETAILLSKLRSKDPMTGSVMSRPAAPEWQPEYQRQEEGLEAVSPEDFIPNPKSMIAALKGAPVLAGVVGKSARDLFAPVIEAPQWKAKSNVVNMSIDDFLKMAERIEKPDQEKLKNIKRVLDSGEKLESLPYLYMSDRLGRTANVTGHEGRHRALALKERGYTHMPVDMRGDIRWSEQQVPQKFDYVPDWPKVLRGEQGIVKTFPIPREKASDEFIEVWGK